MQTDTTPTTNPAVAVNLIQKWKSDPALRDQYDHDAGAFFLEAEWQADSDLRAEFSDDFAAFSAFSRRAADV